MSLTRFVATSLSIKQWSLELPAVEAVRPAVCPCCGRASRPTGEPLNLHGHGVRVRSVRGPLDAVGPVPKQRLAVVCRRYQCQWVGCGAIVLVGPRELAPGQCYVGTAILLALFHWAVEGLTHGRVWAKVTGHDPRRLDLPDRWRTLTRWGRAALGGALFRGVSGDRAGRITRAALMPLLQKLVGLAPAASREEPNVIRVKEGAFHAV